MSSKPIPHRCRRAAGKQVDDAPPFQVADDGAVDAAAPPSPVIDADHAWRWRRMDPAMTNQAQDGVAADRHRQSSRQTGTGLTAQHHTDIGLCLGQPFAATRLARSQPRHGFDEDPPWAVAAAEAADLQAPRHSPVLPRQVLEGSLIGAVHPRRGSSATRTGGIDRGGVSGDQQPARVQR